MFWTTEIYADGADFAAHRATDVHAAAARVLTELIAGPDLIIGETLVSRASADPQLHRLAASSRT